MTKNEVHGLGHRQTQRKQKVENQDNVHGDENIKANLYEKYAVCSMYYAKMSNGNEI